MFKREPEPHTHTHAHVRTHTRQPDRDPGEHLSHTWVPSVFQLSVIFQSDTALYKESSLFLYV